jgi:hypothetical protein
MWGGLTKKSRKLNWVKTKINCEMPPCVRAKNACRFSDIIYSAIIPGRLNTNDERVYYAG